MTVKEWYEKNQNNMEKYGKVIISDFFCRWNKTDVCGRRLAGSYKINNQIYKPSEVMDRHIHLIVRDDEEHITKLELYPY